MDYIIENWYYIVSAGLVLAAGVIYFMNRKEAARKWLLHAVTLAEKELGGGTGKLKLRYAYDLFITKFKWFSVFVPFDTFSFWVDIALEEMKEILQTNEKAARFVTGEESL